MKRKAEKEMAPSMLYVLSSYTPTLWAWNPTTFLISNKHNLSAHLVTFHCEVVIGTPPSGGVRGETMEYKLGNTLFHNSNSWKFTFANGVGLVTYYVNIEAKSGDVTL